MTAETWSAIAAVVAAVGTMAAAVAAIFTWRATSALTAIESRRELAEWMPQFRITCTRDARFDFPVLEVNLIGPHGIPTLNECIISIVDNWTVPKSSLTGGQTDQALRDKVWAPYQFQTHKAVTMPSDWRSVSVLYVRPFELRTYDLMRTPHGQRQRERGGEPVLLSITSRRDGTKWTTFHEVEVLTVGPEEVA